jgi:hypothetical protein
MRATCPANRIILELFYFVQNKNEP